MKKKGLHSAILSAFLFGLSPVACKAIVGQMSPSLLAGLLYLGSGLGLTGLVYRQRLDVGKILAALSWRQWGNLAGAILSGGVAAPLFLAYGIRYGTATEVSLLLNFEAVATTLLAWLIFREHIGQRVWIGKLFIVGASLLVVLTGSGDVRLSIPGLCVLAACFLWGVDNNLTRELETLSPTLLACLKGWSAGLFNVFLALALFKSQATPFQVSGSLAIGALSYGASLVLFIQALREIGSARTSTWFASGPFIGAQPCRHRARRTAPRDVLDGCRPHALRDVFPLSENGTGTSTGTNGSPMPITMRMTSTTVHRHEDAESEGNHDHYHVHEPIEHVHVHWPDIHHRHSH